MDFWWGVISGVALCAIIYLWCEHNADCTTPD